MTQQAEYNDPKQPRFLVRFYFTSLSFYNITSLRFLNSKENGQVRDEQDPLFPQQGGLPIALDIFPTVLTDSLFPRNRKTVKVKKNRV